MSHFGPFSKNVQKSDLKSPEIIPFGVNLTHFRAKSGIPFNPLLRMRVERQWLGRAVSGGDKYS